MTERGTTVGANALIEPYLHTDKPLSEIIAALPEPRPPVIEAIRVLQDSLARRRLARDAIRAAQAVEVDEVDPDLLVLMLTSWAELSCRIPRPAEAEALIHRAQALLTDRAPAEIRAAAVLAESILADTTGDKTSREAKLREALALLPADSPRRKLHAWELALFLAQQGRLAEFDRELREMETLLSPGFGRDRLAVVRFIDAVETGRVAEARTLEADAARNVTFTPSLSASMLSGYQSLLRLMAGETRSVGMVRASSPPLWLQVVRHLVDRRPGEALSLARSEADRLLGSFLGTGFESFNMIRAELAAGSADAARRLMRMREARGNHHYVDDLFYARIESLAGNETSAARHFAGLLRSIERYHARGRLDFEVQLAGELSPSTVIALTREAENLLRSPVEPRTAVQAVPPGLPAVSRGSVDAILGRSAGIAHVRELIVRFADADAPVLITGETGTGKELVARALHEASHRRPHGFVAVNCGSIAETLLDSELFGHQRGAFTGADRANKGLFEDTGEGTILLDEMGEILPRLQQALLRVIESGEIRAVGSTVTRRIRCRILAATNADLNRLADEGLFRRDLIFRLQRLGVHIPPLRERREDIPLLAQHFIDMGRAAGVRAQLSPELMRVLQAYDWPGNVRELKNVMERMRLMHSDKLVYSLPDLDLKFHAVPVAMETRHAPAENTPRRAGPARIPLALATPPRLPEPPDRAAPADDVLRNSRSRLRREERLLELFRRYRRLTRREVVDVLGISPNTATKELKALCDAGIVTRVEPSASSRSHYFVLKEATPRRPGE